MQPTISIANRYMQRHFDLTGDVLATKCSYSCVGALCPPSAAIMSNADLNAVRPESMG